LRKCVRLAAGVDSAYCFVQDGLGAVGVVDGGYVLVLRGGQGGDSGSDIKGGAYPLFSFCKGGVYVNLGCFYGGFGQVGGCEGFGLVVEGLLYLQTHFLTHGL